MEENLDKKINENEHRTTKKVDVLPDQKKAKTQKNTATVQNQGHPVENEAQRPIRRMPMGTVVQDQSIAGRAGRVPMGSPVVSKDVATRPVKKEVKTEVQKQEIKAEVKKPETKPETKPEIKAETSKAEAPKEVKPAVHKEEPQPEVKKVEKPATPKPAVEKTEVKTRSNKDSDIGIKIVARAEDIKKEEAARAEARKAAQAEREKAEKTERTDRPERRPFNRDGQNGRPGERRNGTDRKPFNREGQGTRTGEHKFGSDRREGYKPGDKKDFVRRDNRPNMGFAKDKDDEGTNQRQSRPQNRRPSGNNGMERLEVKHGQKDVAKRSHAEKERDKFGKFENQNLKKNAKYQIDDDYSLEKAAKPKKHSQYKQIVEETVDVMEAMPTGTIAIACPITVGGFAEQTQISINSIIMALMKMGVMANINQNLDEDTVGILASELGISVMVTKTEEVAEETGIEDFEDKEEDLKPRAPFVTVMGHVDHGKTSLLDAIRQTNVASGEAGGITQHIGASEVTINGKKIVFLDTPGHEAFTAMRARGAHVTDIAVLVVAADDGVMPQTIESISHAKAAGVPIIVAINKMDKPGANPDRVKQELTEHGILVEDWGGETICVPVSAKTGQGVKELLEMILLQAEVLELKANPNRMAKGSVVEARLDKNKGPVATLLVDNGTLKSGQSIVVGNCYGRIRLMTDFRGKTIAKAGPATAVEILGLDDVPEAGDEFNAVKDDKTAREIATNRKMKLREEVLARNASSTLEKLFSQIQEGEVKDLNLIIKADVQGSVEAIVASLEKLSNDSVRVKIVHTGVGTVSESDVMLASTTGAIIIGFNVRPTTAVQTYANQENVQIRLYSVIYDIINDIEDAMKGMLDPEFKEEVLGKIEVRDTFKVPGVGTIAGAYVIEGKAVRNAQIRLVRDGIVIHEGKISSLKRFKDDAKEVAQGFECGIGIENYNDIKIGDVIECFHMVEVERK